MGGCSIHRFLFLFLLAIETECIQWSAKASWCVAVWIEAEWTKGYYLGGHKKVYSSASGAIVSGKMQRSGILEMVGVVMQSGVF